MMKGKGIRYAYLCFFLSIIGFISSDERNMEKSVFDTIQIAIPIQERNWLDKDITVMNRQNDRINEYLVENEKNYRIEFKYLTYDEDKEILAQLQEYDLIAGNIAPEIIQNQCVDISEELKLGHLHTVYASVPEKYWESLYIDKKIYSIVGEMPAGVHTLYMNLEFENSLTENGIYVPEKVLGQPLWMWDDYMDNVYTAIGGVNFIYAPNIGTFHDPILGGNAWEAHFRLILPFLGIEYDHQELGVQCIYESEYSENMQELWIAWKEKGYVGSKDMLPTDKYYTITKYDLDMRQGNAYVTYPLQEECYLRTQVATVPYYQVVIPRNSRKKDLTFQFLCDLTEEPVLLEIVSFDESGNLFENIGLVPEACVLEAPGKAPLYDGTVSENIKNRNKRLEQANLPLLSGFVFDIEPVKESVTMIEQFLRESANLTYLRLDDNSNWKEAYQMQEIVDTLYKLGLQEVIDEVNYQIMEYESMNNERN